MKTNSMSFWEPCDVYYKPHAVKDLSKMGREAGERIRRVVSIFAQTGRGDVKLIDRERRYWEIRVGLHYRAAFQFEDRKIAVLRTWRK